MRLGLVTQWYDPEGSSAALPGVIARSLAAHGHEVHVLTGFPNYPDGEILGGYRQRPYLRESFQGVTVHRDVEMLDDIDRLLNEFLDACILADRNVPYLHCAMLVRNSGIDDVEAHVNV